MEHARCMVVLASASSPAGSAAEEIILRLLIQLVIILAASRIVTWLCERMLGQTDAAGEILAGLLLGPSLLGALAPGTLKALFPPESSGILAGVAQIGLVLLMFQIGLEFEFGSHLKNERRKVLAIGGVALAVPFAAGWFVAPWFWESFAEPRPGLAAFRLFFAVALSITAVPVLGRIFIELGLAHTRTAALAIGAAATEDVAGWLVLGAVAVVARGGSSWDWVLPRLGLLALYLAAVFLVAAPLATRAIDAALARDGRLRTGTVAWVLVLVFLSAAATSALGVFAIIGGFIIGVALHNDRRFAADWKLRVGPLVWTLLLPVFFAVTGLRTDVGSLRGASEWLQCGLIVLLAFAVKFGSAFVTAKAMGEDVRTATTLGVCMNTRGLMELVALNVGLELGVLPQSMFTKLVLMAVASTLVATPAIRALMKGERRQDVEGHTSVAVGPPK
ncbi:MAG: cation:proton antiporter [Planctomycetia bacterium]|nr:cation:proton antiporter [Planctomycetia bacterium]